MKIKVKDKEIDHVLSIVDYTDLLQDYNVPAFLKRLLGDDYAELTQGDRVQFEADLADDLNSLTPENLDHKEMEWNGYRLPESLEDTTMRQEEDLRMLHGLVKAEKGEDMTDFDMMAPALAVYCVKMLKATKEQTELDNAYYPESYDSSKVMERLEEMKQAPIAMGLAWQFFFLTQDPNLMRPLLPYFPDLLRSLQPKQQPEQTGSEQGTPPQASLQA